MLARIQRGGQWGELSRTVRGRAVGLRFAPLFCEEVVEGFHRGKFVFPNIKNGVELRNVQHVLDFLSEVKQLQFASGISECGEAPYQFPDAGAVAVVDGDEIENDVSLLLLAQVAHRLP